MKLKSTISILLTLSFSSQAAQLNDNQVLDCAFANGVVSNHLKEIGDIKTSESFKTMSNFWADVYGENHSVEDLQKNGAKTSNKMLDKNEHELLQITKECMVLMTKVTH